MHSTCDCRFAIKKNVVRIEIIGIMDTSTYTQGVAKISKENIREELEEMSTLE